MSARFGSVSRGLATRDGLFRVYWKNANHVSSLYGSAMPFSLFFSGMRNPYDFAFNLAGAFGVTAEQLEALRPQVERLEPHERLGWLAQRLRAWSNGKLAVEVALLERYYETFQGHIDSYARYAPAPADVPTTLVVALENAVEPEARGWSALLGGDFHIERVNAGHFELLRAPYVARICRLMEDEIDKEKADV